MNYKEAKAYINKISKYGSVLGLKSITTLLKTLNNPHKELKVVHIAGTNGKGSTVEFLKNIFMEAGYKAGTYCSPAVFDEDEIIQINGKNIGQEDLADIITLIKDKADMILETYGFHPTCFEIETAMAFEYFRRKQCDIVFVECGMGGKSDATNVFEEVLCSVITGISLDHTAFLGDNLEEIAEIKAGIIKKHCPVVAAKQNEKVLQVIENTAVQKEAPLIKAGVAQINIQDGKNHITYPAVNGKTYEADIQMLGTYQAMNVAAAVETALCLQKRGYKIEQFIEKGLSKAKWKGRMEIISDNPLFIIDGAHNPGAVSELRDSIEFYFTNKRITFIMGVLADKDFEQEAAIIAHRAENIITVTPDNARAFDGRKLAEILSRYNRNTKYAQSITEAVTSGKDDVRRGKTDMIIAFGTLSHLKDIKQAVKAGRRD